MTENFPTFLVEVSHSLLVLQFTYCKTLYFCCILISRFWDVEISLHFNLAFSRCSTSIYQALDGQTEFSRVFNFTIFSYSRNSRKFDAREKYVFYSMSSWQNYSFWPRFCTFLYCQEVFKFYKSIIFLCSCL